MPPNTFECVVEIVGPMPFPRNVAYALWGADCIFNSDGNASGPEDVHWRSLMVSLRSPDVKTGIWRADDSQRVEVDPAPDAPNKLRVSATSAALLEQALAYLERSGSVRREVSA